MRKQLLGSQFAFAQLVSKRIPPRRILMAGMLFLVVALALDQFMLWRKSVADAFSVREYGFRYVVVFIAFGFALVVNYLAVMRPAIRDVMEHMVSQGEVGRDTRQMAENGTDRLSNHNQEE